jgi:hypothetical protein
METKKHSWNYNSAEIVCSECKKIFMVPKSHINKRFTCSNQCSGKRKTRLYLEAVAGRTEKPCYHCKKILPLEMFNKQNQKPDGRYPYCKECHKKTVRKWEERHPEFKERIKIRRKNKLRKTSIRYGNGNDIKNIIKRNYPKDEKCEICKKNGKRLVYHHWDNDNFLKGIWICNRCHIAAHWLEEHNPNLFYNLKSKIELLSS